MSLGLKETERGFRLALIGHRGGPSAEAAAAYVLRKVLQARRRFDGPVDKEEQSRRALLWQAPEEHREEQEG